MKLEKSKEEKGNLAFKVCWVSIGSRYCEVKRDTKQEALIQIEHLLSLGFKFRDIAIYRSYEMKE